MARPDPAGRAMLRRDVIKAIAALSAFPSIVRAQQGDRMQRIGILMPGQAKNEKIVVDGTTITFGANSSGSTAANGKSYSVSIVGGTATVTLMKAAGITASAFNSLVNGINYQDTNIDNPSGGTRTFTLIQIKDSGGTTNGGVDTTTLNTVSTVTVVPVNDAPIAAADSYTVVAGGTFTASQSILVNDTDPENNPLTAVKDTDPAHGTIVWNTNGSFTYTATAGFYGTDSFTYHANDGSNAVLVINEAQSITLVGTDTGALSAENFVYNQDPSISNFGTMEIGDGAFLPLSGTITNNGSIVLSGESGETNLQIIQQGATLTGGGHLLLSDCSLNMISGTSPDVTLTNSSTISSQVPDTSVTA